MPSFPTPDLDDAALERAVGRLYLRYAALEAAHEALAREHEGIKAATGAAHNDTPEGTTPKGSGEGTSVGSVGVN